MANDPHAIKVLALGLTILHTWLYRQSFRFLAMKDSVIWTRHIKAIIWHQKVVPPGAQNEANDSLWSKEH